MEKYVPLILDEQEQVIKWSREMYKKHISFSTVIEYLVSDNKCGSSLISNGLEEVRNIYKSKNQAWREQLLKSLILDRYKLQNDIKEGQVVTNDSEVGFAVNVNYTNRNFELSTKRDGTEILGLFEIDEFKKV